MPSVDFGACLANYWFVWSVNGLGSIFGLAINMAVSFFFLKYFHNIQGKTPSSSSSPSRPSSSFGSIGGNSPSMSKTKV